MNEFDGRQNMSSGNLNQDSVYNNLKATNNNNNEFNNEQYQSNNNNNQINENKNIENIQLNLFFYAISFKNEFERLREKIGFNNINNIKNFKNNIIISLSELINKINIKNL